MTRTLSKILILVLMVVVFFAPVGASFEKKDNQIAFSVEVSKANAEINPGDPSGFDFECNPLPGPGSAVGCVAEIIYGVIWWPISLLTSLSAKIMDFFIYYSTNSTSYSGSFVGKAWGAVRDIANIFFIIGLLYVAIETILGIGHNGKKMIASIVVVALLINFSLFFTQVVIDTSNILARVFYNNFQQVDKNDPTKVVTNEPTSISTNLVSIFNPQEIIQKKNYTNNVGLFIFITLISAVLMAFMVYIFLSVALLFVGRVAGLWVAMVFAPIAFASYTVPFEIPGLGHKKWWSDLLKQAFLAPIFIFFLYVILLFGDALKQIPIDISQTSGDKGGYLDAFLRVIIPFAIIFVLIQQAKKLAVEYSGTIGESFSKAGSFVAGAATGGIIGAYAGIGRGTIGRLGNTISKSSTLNTLSQNKTFGFVGRGLTNASKFVATSSFDARGTGLVSGVGQAAKGGYVGDIKKRSNIRLERLENIKEGANKDLKGKLKTSEEILKQLELDTHGEIAEIDEAMKAIREQQNDVSKMPAGAEKEARTKMYSDKLNLFKAKKDKLQKGEKFEGGKYLDDDGITEKTLDEVDYSKKYGGRSLSKIKKDVKELKHDIEHSEIKIGLKFIKNHESSTQLGEAYDFITARNVVNKDTKNKIIMGIKASKEEKGGGDHGGGSHGGGSHSPKPAAKAPAASGGHGGGGAAHH